MEKYRTALILGYGRSGRAAERLLHAEGAETVVFTQEDTDETAVFETLEARDFDICIVSPGFGLSNPWIRAVCEAEIPLLSEVELGWSRHRGKTVAVTGSNGKSTAVKWICEMLQLAGQKAEIGGNYGIPACEAVLENPDLDWLVLEVSSFQLETVQDFRAEVEPPSPDPSVFEVVDAVIAELAGEKYILGPSGGEVAMVLLGGMERGLTEFITNPEAVRAATRHQLAAANAADAMRDAWRRAAGPRCRSRAGSR